MAACCQPPIHRFDIVARECRCGCVVVPPVTWINRAVKFRRPKVSDAERRRIAQERAEVWAATLARIR